MEADLRGLHEAHPIDHTACTLVMVGKAVAHGRETDLVLLADCVRNAYLIHQLEGRDMPWLIAAAQELEAHSRLARAHMRLRVALQLCMASVTVQTTRCALHCTHGT